MKTKQSLIVMALMLAFTTFAVQAQQKNTKSVSFDVNMHCNDCVQKIEKNIAFEKGVKDMKVNLADKKVCLSYDSTKTDVTKLQKAIVKLGYTAEESKNTASAPVPEAKECKKACDSAAAPAEKAECKKACDAAAAPAPEAKECKKACDAAAAPAPEAKECKKACDTAAAPAAKECKK